jgi:hypothetical protein
MRTTFLTSFFNKTNDNYNTPTIDLTELAEDQPTNIPLTNQNQIPFKMASKDLEQRSTDVNYYNLTDVLFIYILILHFILLST